MIPFEMRYNRSMLCHRFSNELRWGGGGGEEGEEGEEGEAP